MSRMFFRFVISGGSLSRTPTYITAHLKNLLDLGVEGLESRI